MHLTRKYYVCLQPKTAKNFYITCEHEMKFVVFIVVVFVAVVVFFFVVVFCGVS